MLKENWRFVARVERLGDFLISIVAFVTAYYGRAVLLYLNQRYSWGLPFEGPELAPIDDYVFVLFIAVITTTILLNLMGAYSSMRFSSTWQLVRTFIVCSGMVFVALAASLFMAKIDVSRSFIALFCLLLAVSLTVQRLLVLKLLRYVRRQGFNYRNVVICGLGEQALRLAREVARRPELGIRIRSFAYLGCGEEHNGYVDSIRARFKADLQRLGSSPLGRIIVGTNELESAFKRYAIDEVIFTDIVEVMPEVEEMVLVCAEQGVRTTLAADLFSIGMIKSGISYFGGMPLIHFQTPPGDRWDLSVKRFLDIVVSSFLLMLLSPVFLAIALLVKLSSPGPVLFVQRRMGLNGRLFDMYKFRSMRVDAEQMQERLAALNEMSGPAFKLRNDPRITSVGRYLRRFSLDELPQLWNVFVGDMSLVGPRPPVPGEVSTYARKYRRRLSMRPGMTCIWQVSGRNEISDFESWVKLDLEYIDNWSLGQDFWLLFRTIPAVLLGTGAR